MMLTSLRSLLESELEVIGTVTDGLELLAAAERLQPDLVITEVMMPGLDGIEVTRRLQAVASGVKVVILSNHAEPSYVRAAFEAGVWGYVPKTSAPEEIERAVHEVLADRFYVSPMVARAAVKELACHREGPAREDENLTPREIEILRLVAAGLGNQQIAEQLGVAVTTVRTHLNNLYEKLHLRNRVELALFAASPVTARSSSSEGAPA